MSSGTLRPSEQVSGVEPTIHPPEIDQQIDSGVAPLPRFGFAIARALGTVVVALRGPIDAAGSSVLKTVLGDLIENQGNLAVVIDVHDVTDVEPAGLDVFVIAQGWALVRGGQVVIAGAEHRVARALELAGVARLVKVTSDRILAVPSSKVPVPDERTCRQAELQR
jgi:anti-anti-sigma factor